MPSRAAAPLLPVLAHAVLPVLAAVCVVAGGIALAWPGLVPVDALSAAFLVAAGVLATADPGRASVARLAAAVLCVTAPNAPLLVLGFELLCALSPGNWRRWGVGAVPMLAVAVLLGGAGFAGVRAQGVAGASAVLLLALAGAGRRLLVPGGGVVLAALYVLARMTDLCGTTVAGWWGLLLLPCGAGLAAFAAWRAVSADTIGDVGGWMFRAGMGAALAALGTAAAARSSDLTEVAGLAVAGFDAVVLAQAGGLAVMAAAGRAVAAGAGTERLPLLGGLAGSMPRTAACLALAGASLALLPPTAGFAAVLPAVQAVVALPRMGTPGAVMAATAGVGGLAIGLGLAAVLRLLATACLGRPRTPRSSAAEDPAGLRALLVLVCAGVLAAAGPGAGLALPALTGLPPEVRPPLAPGALPGLAVLLALVGAPAILATRRGRRVGAWSDGRGRTPAWLPFGDPAEQWSAAAFAVPFRLPRLHPGSALDRLRRLRVLPGWEVALFVVLLAGFCLLLRP